LQIQNQEKEMKIEINSKQFGRALEKAIQTKPLVRLGGEENQYLVRGSRGDFYPVKFVRGSSGAMFGYCHCAAAMRDFHCYHLAAALLAHSAFVRAGLRRPAARRALSAFV
jgi:hypothetical protein